MITLQKQWELIAKEFGLNIVIDYKFICDNIAIEVPVLLKDFGAKNGMLIIDNYRSVSSFVQIINQQDFGFSCLTSSKNFDLNISETRSSIIEMLSDWGWSSDAPKPYWLPENSIIRS